MKQRFAPMGLLALQPQAFGLLFEATPGEEPLQQDGVVLLTVRGPLMHHASWCFDSYDAIKARVAAAVAAKPRALVLSIDSPGGLVSGCFDTVRELRALCQQAQVPVYAFVDGSATSAAYALACVADRIYVPEAGIVGSIGVLDTLVDQTRQAEMMGLQVRLVASGARKTDGNPNQPLSDESLRAAQERVDSLANLFFDLVAEARPGLSVDQLRSLEAGLVHGAEAVRFGLADEVSTLDQLLASVASGTAGERTMASNYEEAIDKLRKAAEGDDEEAKRARKMLAAMDEDDSDEEASDHEDDSDEEASSTASDDSDEEASAASAAASASANPTEALAARLQRLEAKLQQSQEREERENLIASRPDLTKEVVAWLRTEPLAVVRKAVKTLPKGPRRAQQLAASAVVEPTRAENQADGAVSRLPAEEKADLDRRMGLADLSPGVRKQGNKLLLGAVVPRTK